MLIAIFIVLVLILIAINPRFAGKIALLGILLIGFIFMVEHNADTTKTTQNNALPANATNDNVGEPEPVRNSHYEDMRTCFSQHLIPPEAMLSARWNDYSFLNTPKECIDVMNEYVSACENNGGKSDKCSAQCAAVWIAVNDATPKSSQGYQETNDSGAADAALNSELSSGNQNPKNNYALNNNPFERNMLECFSKRIAMGGKWNPDDGLQSATKLAQDPACQTIALAYFNWCKVSGAEIDFCGAAAAKGAELTIMSTPYNLRMHESPAERAQIERAIADTKKAAESGDVNAETRLGLIYFESNGIRPRSPEKALPWFEKAAAQGSMDAQAKLGTYYLYGMIVKRNPIKAEDLWKKAAAQGSSEAANYLGSLYENGTDGIPQNSAEAIRWYEKAAATGNDKAKESLEKLHDRLQKSPDYGSNIMFIETKWGINETSDQDPACMQKFDHDLPRYKMPSRHSLDICLLNMIHGVTLSSDTVACSLPLDHWCQDKNLGPEKCMTAKESEYDEVAQACPPATNSDSSIKTPQPDQQILFELGRSYLKNGNIVQGVPSTVGDCALTKLSVKKTRLEAMNGTRLESIPDPAVPIDALIASGTLRDFNNDRMTFRHDVLREWAIANLLFSDATMIERLPFDRPASASLARGVELTARMMLERAADGENWHSFLTTLSREGAHGSWWRAALLALVRSEIASELLERASVLLLTRQLHMGSLWLLVTLLSLTNVCRVQCYVVP